MSAADTTPTTFAPLTTGAPLMWFAANSSAASRSVISGVAVTTFFVMMLASRSIRHLSLVFAGLRARRLASAVKSNLRRGRRRCCQATDASLVRHHPTKLSHDFRLLDLRGGAIVETTRQEGPGA